MGDMISVIVTGSGAPGTIGTIYALRNNPDGAKYRIITTDMKDDVAGKFLSDGFYTVPRPEDPRYIRNIGDIVQKENAAIIIPQTTREIAAISKHSDHFNNLGARVVASRFECLQEANNKFTLLARAKEVGVPYPSFNLTQSEEEFVRAVEDFGYPKKKVVVKPPVSNGMRGLRILAENAWNVQRYLGEKPDGSEIDLESLLAILRRGKWPEMLVAEYLEGIEYTVDVFRNDRGTIVIPRLRKNIRSGITFEAQIDLREDLIEYSRKLAEACDLKYCFGFQFKLSKKGVPKLLECNPRVQGTMVFSAFAGFNMIYYSVLEALGHPVDTASVKLRDKIEFKRYWGGLATSNGNYIGRL